MNILQVGLTPSDRPYIVMPYHAADSLALRLRRSGPIPWPEALKIGVKLCGALEIAHRSATLHRDIKPGNVLLTDYGEPQLSDFGIARIAGKYQTVTGVFSGTIAYTSPEVLSGRPPTVAADLYSLGATMYAVIAGTAPYENVAGDELIAHYLRITSEEVPDLRPRGIPDDVCAAIEQAMSLDPAKRPASAADLGRAFQAAQRRNGLPPDSMALPIGIAGAPADGHGASDGPLSHSDPSGLHSGPSQLSETPFAPIEPTGAMELPVWTTTGPSGYGDMPEERTSRTSNIDAMPGSGIAGMPPRGSEPSPKPFAEPRRGRRKSIVLGSLVAVAVLVLVIGVGLVVIPRDSDTGPAAVSGRKPTGTAEAQAGWRPITNARVARAAVSATESDGTIWIFGGLNGDGSVSGRHEGYDPAIDSWKGGDDLPAPVQHAMAVTWQSNPVVLGGVQADGTTSNRVWRVVSSHWVELPRMLQPRSAAAAAVVGDRIIVTGGLDASGKLLNTTEIFDGNTWTLGAPIPTPRQLLGGASDDKLMYAVGGKNAKDDLPTVEAYDPAADTWTPLPALAKARSDLGVAIADKRLVAIGGVSGDQVLKSVAAFDLSAKTWADMPDMDMARHGMAAAAVDKKVYAIGGSTSAGDDQVTSSAESLKLAPGCCSLRRSGGRCRTHRPPA